MIFDTGLIGELTAAIIGVATVAGLASKWMTGGVARDIKEQQTDLSDLKHAVKNQTSRIDAIEHLRNDDNVRVAKLEVMVEGLQSSVGRVEGGQEKLTDTINDWMKTLTDKLSTKD